MKEKISTKRKKINKQAPDQHIQILTGVLLFVAVIIAALVFQFVRNMIHPTAITKPPGTSTPVIAGFEGTLPGVVASLVDIPVIAVPTSIGYGVGIKGFGAMIAMLSSCSPGIGVVNIDNGFGDEILASLISKRVSKFRKK